jgi:Undecaprenyl-phosphate glucose phosphotransferase
MSNVVFSSQSREDVPPAEASPQAGEGTIRNHRWRRLLRPLLVEKAIALIDVLLIVVTSAACSAAYLWTTTGEFPNELPFIGIGIIVAVNFIAFMSAQRNYRLKNLIMIGAQTRDAFVVWTCVCGMLIFVGYAVKISAAFSRGSTILFFLAGLAALCAWRVVIAKFIAQALTKGLFATKDIIVITEQNQGLSSYPLFELQRYGYRAIKTCEISPREITSVGITASLRAKLADIVRTAKDERIEDIYLLVRWHHHRIIDGILEALNVLPVSVHLVPDASATRFLNSPIATIGETWTAEVKRAPLTRTELRTKRCVDLVLATCAILFLLPLILITALFIKLDSRGPVFFLQKRHGFNGQTFNIFKFRTMHVLEDGPVVQQAKQNDPRVTRLGRWLRRSSIDELPQFFNVIRGEMSLVGPRPHAASHNSEYGQLIANYAFRHHVKPGLTGWAQVNGYRGETHRIEQMERRVECDLWYINNWSLWLDLKILFRTLYVTSMQAKAY